jgi:hypothetical protein
MPKSQLVATVMILVGVLTIAVAGVIPAVVPQEKFWNEQQAQERSQAAARLHQMTHESAHMEINERASEVDRIHAQQQLDAAQARFDQSQQALSDAQFWRTRVPQFLRWLGSGIAVAGILVFLATKDARN